MTLQGWGGGVRAGGHVVSQPVTGRGPARYLAQGRLREATAAAQAPASAAAGTLRLQAQALGGGGAR